MCNYINISIIREIGLELGFRDIGASKLESIDMSSYMEWLDRGYNADMRYMSNYIEKRHDPRLFLEDSISIISFIIPYNASNNNNLKFASYAHYYDYHILIKKALYSLINKIKDIYPDFRGIPFVDTAPILEKYWAMQSGLGYIGKNSLLINRNYGSRILIGEVIINYRTDYNNIIEKDLCKDCSLCISQCPNNAINPNKTINANLCNSYHTIENKNPIPENINLEEYIFGCDICLNVCPWNKNNQEIESNILEINPYIQELEDKINTEKTNKETNKELDKSLFNKAKKNSVLSRIKFNKLRENLELL